jgi:hypothetical protein
MRLALRFVLFAAFFCIATATNASTFSQTITGTVESGDVDFSGLFGSVNGNIGGDAFSLTITYNTSDFPNSQSCGPDCTSYTATTNASSDYFALTINGETETYTTTSAPRSQDELFFSGNEFEYYIDQGQSPDYYEILGFYNSGTVALGQQLSPETVMGDTMTTFNVFRGGNDSTEILENINLDFPQAVSATPEPGSLLLSLTGIVGALALRERLIKS